MVGRGERERLGPDRRVNRLDGDGEHRRVAGEPEPREAARGVRRRQLATHQLIEEVTLEPALGLRDRTRLRELDREQAERMAGDDPVELRRLFGRADREERLDPALRADRLDPHVMALVEHRERERGGLGP